MRVSKHAKDRLKERCGLNKKSHDRIAAKALLEGITHSQTKGHLNKRITSLYFKNKNANNIRLFGDKAYIFCDEILVTIIQIPANLTKEVTRIKKGLAETQVSV